MKGISHFVAGVAAASFFPGVVEASADGNPWPLVVGGVFGLLPDTLDFRFSRFLWQHDVNIVADPANPDPATIADGIAKAVREANNTGKPVNVRINTIRLGADAYRSFGIEFRPRDRRVIVRMGPIVTTGDVPLGSDVDPPPDSAARFPRAEASLDAPVVLEYLAETRVAGFDGPSYTFRPTPDGRVRLEFIPWHRTWSHSLTAAWVCGLGLALLARPLYGLVAAAGIAAHILFDQAGHMGSCLLYPFQRRRTSGLRRMHSGDALPNLSAVWLCCLLTLVNFARAAPVSVPRLPALPTLLFAGVLPMTLLSLIGRISRRRRRPNRTGR